MDQLGTHIINALSHVIAVQNAKSLAGSMDSSVYHLKWSMAALTN